MATRVHGLCRIAGALRQTVFVLGLILVAASTGQLRAQTPLVALRYRTNVAAGQTPAVVFVPSQAIAKLVVRLRRDDGERVEAAFGATAAGQEQTLALDASSGRRRYEGEVEVEQGSHVQRSTIAFETQVAAALELRVDRSALDLTAGRLVLTASRALASVAITVHAGGGSKTVKHDVPRAAAGAPLTLSFPTSAGQPIVRIDVKATDEIGFYTGVSLLPWSMTIPHEEVAFASDKADIGATERPKLDASLKLIGEALERARTLGPVALYIAGHTDTVGADAYNLKLSAARAQAIARYMRGRGLRIPIFFEGFGESSLAVATADERDEPRNRRADYILALEPPAVKTRAFAPQWKRLP